MPTVVPARLRRGCAALVAGVLCLALAPLVGGPSAHAAAAGAGDKARRPASSGPAVRASSVLPGRYVVELDTDATDVDVVRDHGRSIRVQQRYRQAVHGFSASMSAATAERLRKDPRVRAVEPDALLTLAYSQSRAPWGLDRIDERTRPLDDHYTYDATGRGVTVYVVDTGVYARHGQFGDRVVRGFDATGEGSTRDCVGHGTHVAGIAAGRTYGVAKSARIVPVRVLNCHGMGTRGDLIAGLDWMARHHRAGTPAVANLSLGGPASAVVDRAVARVLNDGVTVVAAAGNEGGTVWGNACGYSPARIPAVLTVGATDLWDWAPDWSNYGPCLDLFAPGVSIRSAGIWSRSAALVEDGTSMAAPFVTGAAAVYLSQHPRATPAAVNRALKSRATTGAVGNPGWNTTRRLLHMPAHLPTRISVAASATSIAKGDRVDVRTVARNRLTAAPLPNAIVRFYRRGAGTTAWRYLASRRTDARGRAMLGQQPLRSMDYLVRHPRSATTQASASRTLRVDLNGKWATQLGIGASADTLLYGEPVAVAGTLRRALDGAVLRDVRVELQQRPSGGSWTRVAAQRTASTGMVRFERVIPRHSVAYRLLFAGNSTLAASASTARPVRVLYP